LNSNFMQLKTDSSVTGDQQLVTLSGQTQSDFFDFFGHKTNDLNIKLNDSIPTDAIIHVGAADVRIDLAGTQNRELTIEGGAIALDLTLGMNVNQSIKIKSGASSIKIKIPREAGAKIQYESGLSSVSLQDFNKISNNVFETANYAAAEKKIDLTVNIGASSLTIVRI